MPAAREFFNKVHCNIKGTTCIRQSIINFYEIVLFKILFNFEALNLIEHLTVWLSE